MRHSAHHDSSTHKLRERSLFRSTVSEAHLRHDVSKRSMVWCVPQKIFTPIGLRLQINFKRCQEAVEIQRVVAKAPVWPHGTVERVEILRIEYTVSGIACVEVWSKHMRLAHGGEKREKLISQKVVHVRLASIANEKCRGIRFWDVGRGFPGPESDLSNIKSWEGLWSLDLGWSGTQVGIRSRGHLDRPRHAPCLVSMVRLDGSGAFS